MESISSDALLQYNNSVAERHREACLSLFQNFGITAFAYCRFFYNGQYLLLTNQLEWLEKWLEKIYSPNNSLLEKEVQRAQLGKFTYLLWPSHSHQDPILSFNSTFNMCNGFDICRRLEDSVEVWSMATTRDNENINFFYVNNIQNITKFCLFYNETCSDIISICQTSNLGKFHNPMNISLNKDLLFEEEFSSFAQGLMASKCLFSTKYGSASLTPREIECLSHLARGKTAKGIAKTLNISPRTVESYLNRVKEKTGNSEKSKLIDWYYQTNFE